MIMKREEKKELLIESCKKINTYHFDRKNFTRAIEEAYKFWAEIRWNKLLKLMEHDIVYYMDDPYTIERWYKTEECNENERAWVIVPVDHDWDIQVIDYNTLDWMYKSLDTNDESND